MKNTKCDLHVHSSASRQSARWILRSLKAPESFTPPELIYQQAIKRGMDLVTLTDVNTIEGVLEIKDLPGVFLSEEVSTLLPESKKPVHILAYDITTNQHEEMARIRDNAFQLLEYMGERGIVNSLAHPFYFSGEDLSPGEWKDLMARVMLVEGRNGTRAIWENQASIQMAKLIRGKDFQGFTAGSDDHCGRFLARTWTQTSSDGTHKSFLANVAAGQGELHGDHGSAVRSAYAVYSIAYSFYRDRLMSKSVPTAATIAVDNFLSPISQDDPEEPTLWHKADLLFHHILKKARGNSSDFEDFLADELIEIGKDLNLRKGSPEMEKEGIEERTYEILNRLTNSLLRRSSELIAKRLSNGKVIEALEAFTAMIPVLLFNIPFPVTYMDRRRGRDQVNRICSELGAHSPAARRSGKRAWVTDTITDLNGVSRTIQKFGMLSLDSSHELAILACQEKAVSFPGWVVNFKPIKEFSVPNYPTKKLSVPPFLEMLRFIEENDFELIYLSTPGPLGLAALGIAKLLGIPTISIYHTDYPRHTNDIIEDSRIAELVSAATGWVYSLSETVMVPSRFYMDDLEALGVPRSRMVHFPRGTDHQAFSPEWRTENFMARFGGDSDSLKLLYTGRLSREKDLDVLAEAFLQTRREFPGVELFLAGDGPYIRELGKDLLGNGGYFCGTLSGEDFSKVCASCDIFVFPSTKDTYGNSVLEAQASGIPCIVTDMGGPQEIIIPDETGIVCRGRDSNSLAEAILKLLKNDELRRTMGEKARLRGLEHNWDEAFEAIWSTGNKLLK
ncbi:MAG: glycosyltransferase [Candidatus Sabulitectum sp.]|nr:glycosyltransferase [Candidatus Sabulitectum sp.]